MCVSHNLSNALFTDLSLDISNVDTFKITYYFIIFVSHIMDIYKINF